MRGDPSTRTGEDATAEYLAVPQGVSSVAVETGARTHQGKVRQNNEDQFLVAKLAKSMQVCKSSLPDSGSRLFSEDMGYLMVVADGMGGAAAGEQASALAVATVEDFTLNTLKWFLHLGGSEEHALLAELRAGIERADRAVIDRARAEPRLHGMGTTLTMVFSIGTDLYLVHAGDTRAYLFHDGNLPPEQARHHKRRNVVTNVIGGPSVGVHAEVHKLRVVDGDILLLCSDGLYQPVDHDEIARTLAEAADPEAACHLLIELALERGGPDNVTAVAARYRIV